MLAYLGGSLTAMYMPLITWVYMPLITATGRLRPVFSCLPRLGYLRGLIGVCGVFWCVLSRLPKLC